MDEATGKSRVIKYGDNQEVNIAMLATAHSLNEMRARAVKGHEEKPPFIPQDITDFLNGKPFLVYDEGRVFSHFAEQLCPEDWKYTTHIWQMVLGGEIVGEVRRTYNQGRRPFTFEHGGRQITFPEFPPAIETTYRAEGRGGLVGPLIITKEEPAPWLGYRPDISRDENRGLPRGGERLENRTDFNFASLSTVYNKSPRTY